MSDFQTGTPRTCHSPGPDAGAIRPGPEPHGPFRHARGLSGMYLESS